MDAGTVSAGGAGAGGAALGVTARHSVNEPNLPSSWTRQTRTWRERSEALPSRKVAVFVSDTASIGVAHSLSLSSSRHRLLPDDLTVMTSPSTSHESMVGTPRDACDAKPSATPISSGR